MGATLANTKLDDIAFVNCQLTHVDFGLCNPFSLRVELRTAAGSIMLCF